MKWPLRNSITSFIKLPEKTEVNLNWHDKVAGILTHLIFFSGLEVTYFTQSELKTETNKEGAMYLCDESV